jgi:hypothetical protein
MMIPKPYIVSGSLAATANFATLKIPRTIRRVSFTLSWTAQASTDGDLFWQGSDDPRADSDPSNAKWVTFTIPAGSYHTLGANMSVAGKLATINASAENAVFNFENPPPFMRLGYTRRGGGAAAQLDVWRSGSES